MFRSFLQAGFECGRLEWQGNFCLLTGTGHLPEVGMRAHYDIALAHGIRTVRDGLPPWLPIEPLLWPAPIWWPGSKLMHRGLGGHS